MRTTAMRSLLGFACVSALLVGCSSGPDATTSSVSATTGPATTTTTTIEPITTGPITTEPATTEPVTTEPVTTQPAVVTSTSESAPSTTASTGPSAEITQPAQPSEGPGGSEVVAADWRVSEGGTGADAWYVFEPVAPRPAVAPLAIIMHGYFEYSGYASMYELIRHTVLQGNVVIYPRWQTDVAAPCPGPYDIEPCMASATNGIRGALEFLRSDPSRVQPDLDRTSYFGFSFGGIITVNLANRYEALGLPRPRVIFLDDPHDGGLDGFGEPALDDSMAGIPADVLLQCHVGAQGVISEAGKAGSSCNALFPLLGQIPETNKDLVMTRPDDHGQPPLSSTHGVCAAREGTADAYDWNFCWKTWDAMRNAAYNGTDREFALGDTPERRDNGTWSDGVPIAALTIQDEAPIGP